ncbi:MAG: VPLPA-CTERM sorting domain-containing protein [Gammaproteobacteria bacterium]|nr:VPLPA-CTERM sorting domain-containing protein [Gammaproteobacteria bacterium]
MPFWFNCFMCVRLILLSGALVSGTAWAALVTVDPDTGTTTVVSAASEQQGPGPYNIGGGLTATGSPFVNVAGTANSGYGLNDNGTWNQSWVATNGAGVVTISLGGLYSFVGGLMNYAAVNGKPAGVGDPVIQALAADGTTVLDTYDLGTLAPISTPGATNGSAFRGVSDPTADIAYLRFSGSYILAHTIEVGGNNVVPLPAAAWLLLSGLAGVGAFARKGAA